MHVTFHKLICNAQSTCPRPQPPGPSALPVQQAARQSASLKNCFLLKLIYSLSPPPVSLEIKSASGRTVRHRAWFMMTTVQLVLR